jgi:hypothetical protein
MLTMMKIIAKDDKHGTESRHRATSRNGDYDLMEEAQQKGMQTTEGELRAFGLERHRIRGMNSMKNLK